MIKLLPIYQTTEENAAFVEHPDCRESLQMTIEYYKQIGFEPPWIGYYAQLDRDLVGSAGFKGGPVDGVVELAYQTFPAFRNQGIGTRICRNLVQIALEADPEITITARTLPEENFSTKILRKNQFELLGTVLDREDGEVWEWEYRG